MYVVGEPFHLPAADATESSPTLDGHADLVTFASRSVGQFLALHRDKKRCAVATDYLGLVPLYLIRMGLGIALSNDLQLLARRFSLRLSRAGIVEALSTREGFTWSTELFEDVERIDGSTVVSVGMSAEVHITPYALWQSMPAAEIIDGEGAIAAVDAAMATITGAANEQDRTIFDMTGGYDTRQIAASLAGARANCVGRVVTSSIDEDSQRSIALAHEVGLKLVPHEVPPEVLLQFHMAYHCTRTQIVDAYYAYSDNDLHLCGMGGSELMHAETAVPDPERLVCQVLASWVLSPSIEATFVDLQSLRTAQKAHLLEGLDLALASGAADPFADFWTRIFVRRFHGQLFERALLGGCRLASPYLLSPFFDAMTRTPRPLKLDRALSKRWFARKQRTWSTPFSTYPVAASLGVPPSLSNEELEALSDHGLINRASWQAGQPRRDHKETLRWRGIARYVLDGSSID